MLSLLGTGLMRIVNIGLLLLIAGVVIVAAWNSYKDGIREEGRDEVRTEVDTRNDELDQRVVVVNDNIIRRVIDETVLIDRRSREIEDEIRNQPSEPLTNVSRIRVERVYEQQRDIREAS
jgi:hypothetical protein